MSLEHQLKVDILIIGGGVIGSSLAMHLSQNSNTQIAVIDFDLEGTFSSSELNAGGVRATWNHPINIEASKKSIEYFEKNAEDVGYRPCGYLWLRKPGEEKKVLHAQDIQKRCGWNVEVLDLNQLKNHAPFLDKLEGVGCATFSPRDGLVNPNRLKNHYREKAQQNKVEFIDRCFIEGCEYKKTKEGEVRLSGKQYLNKPLDLEQKEKILTFKSTALQFVPFSIQAKKVVNCAGAWASHLAKILGYEVQSKPVRRQVSLFSAQNLDLNKYGMIVDTSGVYFHPEATYGLAGFADPSEKEGLSFAYEEERFFEEKIWAPLYERSTYFEALKHITGWAGLYEVSSDHSALVGLVQNGEAGKSHCVYDCHSFSGHGVMQSYSVPLALSELILTGNYQSMDMRAFAPERFHSDSPFERIEENLII